MPPFAENAEADFGIGQGILFEQVMTVADFDVAALQEFETRGNGVEEVAHGERGAFGRGGGGYVGDLPVAGANLRSLRGVAMATDQCDLGDGCDAGEGFAAKTERANVFQVVDLRYFAGGMPR